MISALLTTHRVSFHCIDENNDIPEQHYMFDTNCVDGMRAQINFQSCWDGVNLYLEDQSHVAYLSGIDYGVCPPTHPVSIPGLFYEVLYFTNEIDQSAGGEFTFSQGDATGYGFHGDFLNGWDMDVQTSAVQDCLYETASQGVVSACPYLAPTDDTNVPRDCLPAAPLNDEPVLGFLTQLPGCNNVTWGPEPAPQLLCPLDSDTPISTQVISSATTPYLEPTSTVSIDYTTVTITEASDTASLTVAVESSTSTDYNTPYLTSSDSTPPTLSTTYSVSAGSAISSTTDSISVTTTSPDPVGASTDPGVAVVTTGTNDGVPYTYTVYPSDSAAYTTTSSSYLSTSVAVDPITTTDSYGNTYTYTPTPPSASSALYTTSYSYSSTSTSDATDPVNTTDSYSNTYTYIPTTSTSTDNAGVFIAESSTSSMTYSSASSSPISTPYTTATITQIPTFQTLTVTINNATSTGWNGTTAAGDGASSYSPTTTAYDSSSPTPYSTSDYGSAYTYTYTYPSGTDVVTATAMATATQSVMPMVTGYKRRIRRGNRWPA